MSTRLAEPVVLAAAKETLYPDFTASDGTYAVTDTQFTTETWGGWRVPDTVRDRLRPFNKLRVGSGEPDLLGVGMPSGPVLNDDAASNPVVVIEAKGETTDPNGVAVGRGIEQAHDRLSEVNLGYVAAPIDSITETSRALARDLNVGIIGVSSEDVGEVLEPARVVGAGEFSREIEAIQFQAASHHLTDGSFPVNHPKNYLGYALALAADGPTERLYEEHVISHVASGKRGAQLLNLVESRPTGEILTHLGSDVVRYGTYWCGSPQAALTAFDEWWGKSTRFTTLAPRWAQLARSVVIQYPPTQLIIEALERLHANGITDVTLPVLAEKALTLNQPLAIEVFFSTRERESVLTEDGAVNTHQLQDPVVFKSGLYFQFKTQLYHVGLITQSGTDSPSTAIRDPWKLEHVVGMK